MRLLMIVTLSGLGLVGCASSSGSSVTGNRVNASPVRLNTPQYGQSMANTELRPQRGLRPLRGLRGLRGPRSGSTAPSYGGRGAGNARATWNWQQDTVDVSIGGFGFQKADRSFWIGPASRPGLFVPHTVGQTGQTPPSQGGVIYDPVKRRFIYP